MKKSIVAVTIAAGLMAYGCGSGNGGDDDFFGGGNNPLPTGSFTVTPTVSPTVTPTTTPGERSLEVTVVQRSPLLRITPPGQLLYRNVTVTGEALQNQNVVITSTIEGEAVFLSDPSWVLSNGDKTLTLTLQGADTQAIALAMATLRARATDYGLGIQVTTQVSLDGGLASDPITSIYYTGNSGALALQVAPSGEVTNLENGNVVSATGGFPAAITAVRNVTAGSNVNDSEGRGSGIYFIAGTHTTSALATDADAFLVSSGDGDLNELLIAGPNLLRSASSAGFGLVGAQPRLPEAILERAWDANGVGQTLLRVQAPNVTVAGLEFRVALGATLNSERGALSFEGLDASVGNSRFIADLGGGSAPGINSTYGIRTLVDDVDVQDNYIRSFYTGVSLQAPYPHEITRNIFQDNGRSVLLGNLGATATIRNNVFDRQGVGTAFNTLGRHIDISAPLSSGAVVFDNNDLYRNATPSPTITPYLGTDDFYASVLQTGVIVAQTGNYSAETALILGSPSLATFITPGNFSGNDISTVTTKNYPNYARP